MGPESNIELQYKKLPKSINLPTILYTVDFILHTINKNILNICLNDNWILLKL